MRLTELQKELVSIALAFVVLGATATAFAADIITVVQRDRKFQTAAVTIPVGGSVRFTNEDPFDHQLYSDSPDFSFSSDVQPRGMILTVPFDMAGIFEVRCEIHPKMLVTVTVQ